VHPRHDSCSRARHHGARGRAAHARAYFLSPLLAARLGIEEDRMYRELRAFVRGVEQEISDRGAVKLLAEAGQAGNEDERGSDD